MIRIVFLSLISAIADLASQAAENVYIKDVPDYAWHAGCFGSASGNLMGFWDRNGFPDFYTGPTANGVAPLSSYGANSGIHSLWASEAGLDGRPATEPGHVDDYWDDYEAAFIDPYVRAGRPEHAPDCLGDFTGASQNKWSDFDGECSGNLDAYAFNFWDKTGAKRWNFTPPDLNGEAVRDLQSGFRAWAESRGCKAETYSQLSDFNPEAPVGTGFTFEDLKAEIDAGYPVLMYLQAAGQFSRSLNGMERANPPVHGMVAYGYLTVNGVPRVRYRTSWASGDGVFAIWGPGPVEAGLQLRGMVAFHPAPKIRDVKKETDGVRVRWDGPSSRLSVDAEERPVHRYVVERSDSIAGGYVEVSEASTAREALVAESADGGNAFYRVKLLPAERPQ